MNNKMGRIWQVLGIYEGDVITFHKDDDAIGAYLDNPYKIQKGNLIDCEGRKSNYYIWAVAEGKVQYRKISSRAKQSNKSD